MKTGFLITARMKSTRLPKKVTKLINNREVISWMIDRVKLSKTVDEIIICTSVNKDDDILEEIAHRENVKCFRGSEEDVILRLYNASEKFNLDFSINITADCPLVSYDYIDRIYHVFEEKKPDLIRSLNLPHGLFSYGLNVESLKKICNSKKTEKTEVWGSLYEGDEYRVFDMQIPQSLIRPGYRLTLDYPDDFIFFEKIFQKFGKDTYSISDLELIEYLDRNPHIVSINNHLHKDWIKRWNSQSKLVRE